MRILCFIENVVHCFRTQISPARTPSPNLLTAIPETIRISPENCIKQYTAQPTNSVFNPLCPLGPANFVAPTINVQGSAEPTLFYQSKPGDYIQPTPVYPTPVENGKNETKNFVFNFHIHIIPVKF